jgi:hypothetical protein
MLSSRAVFARSVARKIALPLVILACLLIGTARADKVDKLISQLTTAKAYKVRLSAALALAKLRDKRAIPAFLKVLSDPDKTVRGVAAASLGKLIDGGTDPGLRAKAERALKRAASKDKNKFVRDQAKKALAALAKIGTGGGGGGGIYVDIGAMSAKVANGKKLRGVMKTTVEKTLAKKASSFLTTWPGGKSPSAKQLSASKTTGFYVDGTLVDLSTKPGSGMTVVSCKVSMLIATYPAKSMFGFLDGGAKVQAGTSTQDIEYAKQDCVTAVVENLVATKIIPTIKSRGAQAGPSSKSRSPRSSRNKRRKR